MPLVGDTKFPPNNFCFPPDVGRIRTRIPNLQTENFSCHMSWAPSSGILPRSARPCSAQADVQPSFLPGLVSGQSIDVGGIGSRDLRRRIAAAASGALHRVSIEGFCKVIRASVNKFYFGDARQRKGNECRLNYNSMCLIMNIMAIEDSGATAGTTECNFHATNT
jgi:hypothetical protein